MDDARFQEILHGRRLTRRYVLDTIAAMRAVGDEEAVEYLDSMLRYDGPDIEGCVVFLGTHGLVTKEWVDRLVEINDIFDDFNDELAELTEYFEKQGSLSSPDLNGKCFVAEGKGIEVAKDTSRHADGTVFDAVAMMRAADEELEAQELDDEFRDDCVDSESGNGVEAFDLLALEREHRGQELVRKYVLDTITAMRAVGDEEAAEYLDSMLQYDGPDLDGCVSSLGKHGLVTMEWVDRLVEINDIFDDLHDELAELTEYFEEQGSAE